MFIISYLYIIKMDFSDLRRLKTSITGNQSDELFLDFSKRRSEGHINQSAIKNVLIIYASGSMAANKQLQIERGGLQKGMSKNFYLCDLQYSKKSDPRLQFLFTPTQQTGVRIKYKVKQLPKIDASVNMSMEDIAKIGEFIQLQYQLYHSFIVITGLDTICPVGTTLSFMLQNLSKLVICAGGYLPLSKMRNDSVSNLVQCFSVVSEASSINDVLIVSKNKGFRANRCIKMTEGDFQNISSPNLPALCSIKTKLRVRSYLFQPQPDSEFRLFTKMSRKVKVIKLNQFQCLESLQYDLKNPFIKGFVIQSFSFANIPNLPQILNLFKQAFEDESRKTIFINISEAICSKNQSVMRLYLQNFHIYYGADMTCQAALAKLSYLIGKGYSQEHIIKLIQSNLRGQLTQQKQKFQFKQSHTSMMQIVNQVLCEYFPSTLKDLFFYKIDNNVSRYTVNNTHHREFKNLFYETKLDQKQNGKNMAQRVNNHHLLHRVAASGDIEMTQFLLAVGADINLEDHHGRSPLFHAIKNNKKSIIQLLRKNGARVISTLQDLFQLFVESIKIDDIEFFNLLYHTEFKQTMKQVKNSEMRTVAHIAGLLKAHKCFKFMKQKFNIAVNEEDVYGVTALQYLSREN